MVQRIALSLLVALLAGPRTVAAGDPTLTELLRRGQQSAADGDLTDAGRALRAAVQASPHNAEARRLLADVYLRADDPRAALAEYLEALRLEPSDAESRTKVAGIYLRDQRFHEAVAQAEHASRLSLEQAEPLAVLARAQVALGRPEEALATLNRAVERAPGDEALRLELAKLHLARKDSTAAERVLRAGFAALPSSEGLRAALANLLAAQGRFPESDLLVDEVVRLAPDDTATLRSAGRYRLRRGDAAGAEALLRRALDLAGQRAPERARALADLADLLAVTDRLSEVGQALEEWNQLSHDDPQAELRLANLFLLSDRPDEAQPWIERLRGRDAVNPNVRLLQARLDLAQGRFEQALGALEPLAESSPDSATVQLYLGKVYAVGRRWEEAEQAYRRVLEEIPGHFFVNLDLAKVHLATGRGEEALGPIGRVLTAQPHFAPGLRLHADALLAAGRSVDAETRYRALLGAVAVGDEGGLRTRLAASIEAQGRFSEALDEYAQARRLAPGSAEAALRHVGLLDRVGKREDADRASREYLEAGAASSQALTALAGGALERGHPELAQRLVARGLAAEPDSAPARELEARLRLSEGDRIQAAALENLSEAHRLQPSHPEIAFHLGLTYEKLGGTAEAREFLRNAWNAAGIASWAPEAKEALNRLDRVRPAGDGAERGGGDAP